MNVLYLKTVLNCGLGAINVEDASKAGRHGSQRARFPVSLRSVQLARFPFSQGQAAVRTAPPTAIKTKTRGDT